MPREGAEARDTERAARAGGSPGVPRAPRPARPGRGGVGWGRSPGASLVVCRSLQGAARRWARELILDRSIPTSRVPVWGRCWDEQQRRRGELGLRRRPGLRLRVALRLGLRLARKAEGESEDD